jgi:hypothetical protein
MGIGPNRRTCPHSTLHRWPRHSPPRPRDSQCARSHQASGPLVLQKRRPPAEEELEPSDTATGEKRVSAVDRVC